MSNLEQKRTPDVIAAEIRTYTGTALIAAMEIGRRMKEAKEILPHGEYGPWLTRETGYSLSTANNFMRLFDAYATDQGSIFGPQLNCQTFGNLTVSKAIALLAVPDEEREKFAVEHDAAGKSVRELKEEIKAAQAERDAAREDVEAAEQKIEDLEETAKVLDAEHRRALGHEKQRAADAEARLKKAKEELRAAKKKAEELTNAPATTVELVEDKEATSAAVRKEQEKAAKQLAKLEAAVKKAEEEAQKARETAEAYKARAIKAEEMPPATAEVEDLKKQLIKANPTIAEFRGVYNQLAAGVQKLTELFQQAPPEAKENLANAMDALSQQLDDAILTWRKM